MKRLVTVLGLLALAAPAAAQQFDGVWYARQQQVNGLGEFQLTIVNGQYALTASLTTVEGYNYQTYQSGEAAFYPPDTLRLVVYDYEPKVYQGNPMTKPPNSNLKVLGLDGSTMVLMDNVCAMSSPASACTSTYQRIQ